MPRVVPPILSAVHAPREKGGEPAAAGLTMAAETIGGGATQVVAGAVMGQSEREYGKSEEPPPAHVTSVPKAEAASPTTAEPGSSCWQYEVNWLH
jgi:hypothetical protein